MLPQQNYQYINKTHFKIIMVVEFSNFTLLFKCYTSCYYFNAGKSVRSKKVKKIPLFHLEKLTCQRKNNTKTV